MSFIKNYHIIYKAKNWQDEIIIYGAKCNIVQSIHSMVKTYEFWIPPSLNLDKVTVSFDKLNNTDLFHQMQEAFIDGSSSVNCINNSLVVPRKYAGAKWRYI